MCACVLMGNTVPVASVMYRLVMKGVNQAVSASSSEILKVEIGHDVTNLCKV